MSEHDELLARADKRLAEVRPYQYGHDGWLIHGLVLALRAVLAAQPEQLKNENDELRRIIAEHGCGCCDDLIAVAGSVTPTDSHGFTDAEHDTLVTLIDRNPKRVQQMLTLRSEAVAGSVTPTEENDGGR